MRLPAPYSPAKRQAAAAAVEMAAAPPCSLLAGQEAGRQRRRGGRWSCASLLGLPEGDGWGRAQWSAGGPRVYRVYPNPNPKLRVPELSGSDFSELKSGSIFYYPNYPTQKIRVTRMPSHKWDLHERYGGPNLGEKSFQLFQLLQYRLHILTGKIMT